MIFHLIGHSAALGLPSHEGSGLKLDVLQKIQAAFRVSPRMRGVD